MFLESLNLPSEMSESFNQSGKHRVNFEDEQACLNFFLLKLLQAKQTYNIHFEGGSRKLLAGFNEVVERSFWRLFLRGNRTYLRLFVVAKLDLLVTFLGDV